MIQTEKSTFQKYSAYKDSGEEWFNKIPKEWEIIKLGSLLKDVSEKNHPNLPLLSITREQGVIVRDVEDDSANHNFIPDDLSGYKLLKKGQFGMNKMKAWQGSYGVSPKTGIVSPAYYIFDFTKPVLPRFFHLAIRSKRYVSYFGSASDGVRIGQWDLSKDRMKKIPFLLPSYPEQTAIANFLDEKTIKIDQAIAQKEQLIALLKERKQIIIQNAVTKGLDPNVKLKVSGVEWIGEIPEHWLIEKGKWLYVQVKRPVRNEDEIVTCFRDGQVTLRKNRKTDGFTNALKEHGYQGVRVGDLVIHNMDAFAGAIGVSDSDGKSTPVYSVCTERKVNTVNSLYYAYYLRELARKGYIQALAKGIRERSTDFRFNDFANLEYALPPISEQNAIVAHIEDRSSRLDIAIQFQYEQISKLKEYKATLIDSAVTGKIKVC